MEKIIFFSCLDWGKKTKIWMKNLNVNELLESCWCHLSNVRLAEVGNFPQTFLTILWEKFYHLFIIILPYNFPPYFFFLYDFLKTKYKKKSSFPIFFSSPPKFSRSKRSLNIYVSNVMISSSFCLFIIAQTFVSLRLICSHWLVIACGIKYAFLLLQCSFWGLKAKADTLNYS